MIYGNIKMVYVEKHFSSGARPALSVLFYGYKFSYCNVATGVTRTRARCVLDFFFIHYTSVERYSSQVVVGPPRADGVTLRMLGRLSEQLRFALSFFFCV